MATLPSLIRTQAFIAGEWCAAGSVFAVTSPASGDVLAEVADCGPEDAVRAIEAAARAFISWRALPAQNRSALLLVWASLIEAATEELAHLLTAEQGKPLAEARTEIKGGIESIRWSAAEACRADGDVIQPFKTGTRVIVQREPVGVVAAITPWNFPVGMITRKVAPALAAGCTVVLKPAEDTPLCALALAGLAEQAGLPAGILNVVPCRGESAPAVGEVLTTHEKVRKISFTGSTGVGKILMRQAAGTVKRVSLELGGNAPFIVFASADLEAAVDGVVASKFRNAGQTCVCANRILVENGIHDAFVERLINKARALELGPLINEEGIAKVEEHVQDAVSKGARLHCGGQRRAGTLYYEPTVLTGMTRDMRLFCEETFGPVAGVFGFGDEAQAVAMANDTPYGLAAYIYTRDLGQALRVPAALESGMVGVNEPILANAAIPFGGVKESGLGRGGGREGFSAFLETKYVLVGGL